MTQLGLPLGPPASHQRRQSADADMQQNPSSAAASRPGLGRSVTSWEAFAPTETSSDPEPGSHLTSGFWGRFLCFGVERDDSPGTNEPGTTTPVSHALSTGSQQTSMESQRTFQGSWLDDAELGFTSKLVRQKPLDIFEGKRWPPPSA